MPQGTQSRAVIPPAAPFPVIVTILAPSSRATEIGRLATEIELAGRIPVVPHVCPWSDLPDVETWNEIYQAQLFALTLRKIDMADEVLVVGADAELGDAIRDQIVYAKSLRKPVRRWAP